MFLAIKYNAIMKQAMHTTSFVTKNFIKNMDANAACHNYQNCIQQGLKQGVVILLARTIREFVLIACILQ